MTKFQLPIALLLLSFAGCKDKAAQPTPTDDAASVAVVIDARPVKMTQHKERPQHFTFLTAAKDSLLFSDVKGAGDSLRWVANPGSQEPPPEAWVPHMETQKSIAAETEGSDNVMVLSKAVANLGRTCGSCHKELDVTPAVKVKEPKHRGLDFKDHMAGHKWALDKMWAGLATPSDEQWIAGATLLADAPTHLRNLSAYGDDADTAMDLAIEVHGLAAKAIKTTDAEARVEIFGTFLAACAHCHELPGSAPKEEPTN